MSDKKQWLHLGLGSFHRAHQAVYMQAMLDAGEQNWTLIGANLRSDMAQNLAALRAQNGFYVLETVSPDGERHYQAIHAISQVLPYSPTQSDVVRVGADAATALISFTVTEAGYYLDSQKQLDSRFADIQADLKACREGSTQVITIYGVITAILRQRRAPVTLLNCDNLRHNGDSFKQGLMQFLTLLNDTELINWCEQHTTCPNAMVDRITPRPAADIALRVKAATGKDDAAALMAESFIQWVVEDNFAAARPPFETVGVQMVSDVLPYEEAKIRLLNATHSCIAWAGTLLKQTYIHDSLAQPWIRQLAFEYVTDAAIPCLTGNPLDLPNYRDVVLARFANPAIADTNQRVAMDGFSKIPSMMTPTIRECLHAKRDLAPIAMLPVLFLHFLQRWHQEELTYHYQDQAMDVADAHAICSSADSIASFAASRVLFGELASHPQLINALRRCDERLNTLIKPTVAK